MSHRVIWTNRARRQLRRLPREVQPSVQSTCEALAEQPRPDGVKKKQGYRNRWEIRIRYRYRADFEVNDDELTVRILEVYARKEGHGLRRS